MFNGVHFVKVMLDINKLVVIEIEFWKWQLSLAVVARRDVFNNTDTDIY